MQNADIIDIEKEDCTGCSACYSACPRSAISMKEDCEGFLYPNVIIEKCIECSLCNLVCPAQKKHELNEKEIMCYAAWNKDKVIRMNSSSGGIFPVLSEEAIKENGIVIGASFKENTSVSQKIITKIEDISDLIGSKYVQSSVGNTFLRTKEFLESDRKVLYSGTPCQIAGLKTFLQKKYENLYTIDVLCHGIPSPLVFRKYLEEEIGLKQKISKICFKDKRNGWKSPSLIINYNDGEGGDIYRFEEPTYKNIYIRGFLKDLFNRPSCGHCKYAMLPRPGDLSLGDFWKIDKFASKLDNDNGTSLVLVNTNKGKYMLNRIKEKIFLHIVPLDIAKEGNTTLVHPNQPHKLRSLFFEDIKTKSIKMNISEKLEKCGVVGLLNFHVSHMNYGALMVAYALSKKIKELGYLPININFIRPGVIDIKESEPFLSFRRRYIPMTEECYNYNDLLIQNEKFNKIVVGSDQVWLQGWHNEFKFYLNWASGLKTLISYAASFGTNKFTGKKSEIIAIRSLLKRFDAISVREKSGIDICEETFLIRAEQVLDPTLFFNAEDFSTIIKDEADTDEFDCDYIGFMFVDEANTEKIIASSFASEFKIINSLKDQNKEYRPFGHWLKCIKNAKFIVTDSFHGTCFSLIFKKQFILINNSYSGNDRITNLLRCLNINSNRFVSSFNEISLESFSNIIDYSNAYTFLETLRETSTSFLERSLSYRPIHKGKFKFPPKYYLAKILEKFHKFRKKSA